MSVIGAGANAVGDENNVGAPRSDVGIHALHEAFDGVLDLAGVDKLDAFDRPAHQEVVGDIDGDHLRGERGLGGNQDDIMRFEKQIRVEGCGEGGEKHGREKGEEFHL